MSSQDATTWRTVESVVAPSRIGDVVRRTLRQRVDDSPPSRVGPLLDELPAAKDRSASIADSSASATDSRAGRAQVTTSVTCRRRPPGRGVGRRGHDHQRETRSSE